MKKAIALVLVLAMAFAVAACGGSASTPASAPAEKSTESASPAPAENSAESAPAAESAEKPVVLTFSAHFSNTLPLGQDIMTAKQVLEEKSGGTMTLDMFFNESLMKQADAFVGLGQGVADISYIPSQNLSDVDMAGMFKILFPKGACPDVPGMTEVYRTAAFNTQLQENLAKYNLHLLDVQALGGKQLCTTKKQVLVPEDLKGLNIAANGNDANFFSEAGAGAVALPVSDYYSGMSNGLVDGMANHYASIYNYKLYEVTKYITEFAGGIECTASTFMMNLDTWNGLTEQQQQWVTETFKEIGDLTTLHHKEDIVNFRQFILDETDITVYTLSEEELAAFAPYMEKINNAWIEKASANGWDAQGAYDLMISEIAKLG